MWAWKHCAVLPTAAAQLSVYLSSNNAVLPAPAHSYPLNLDDSCAACRCCLLASLCRVAATGDGYGMVPALPRKRHDDNPQYQHRGSLCCDVQGRLSVLHLRLCQANLHAQAVRCTSVGRVSASTKYLFMLLVCTEPCEGWTVPEITRHGCTFTSNSLCISNFFPATRV